MSSADVIRTLFEFSAAVTVVLCFVFEKKLIAFENSVWHKLSEHLNEKD